MYAYSELLDTVLSVVGCCTIEWLFDIDVDKSWFDIEQQLL